MRTFIAGHFHKHYHVIEVSNGREALDRLEKEPVDIVLSDIMMPSMDGLSMLEHIRQHDCWRHLPVMLLTARAADEDRILALRARADDYLPKPFDSEELLLRVRNLLERKAAEKERPPESGTDKSETNTSLKKLASADQVFLDKARRIVFDNLQDNDFDVSKLAQSLHISKPTLQRRLTKSMNTTPAIFMRNIRLEHAHHLIQQKTYRTMAEVAHAVGFNSPGYFAKLYKQANFQ
jgi:DNA-binding response OmpR family regulator